MSVVRNGEGREVSFVTKVVWTGGKMKTLEGESARLTEMIDEAIRLIPKGETLSSLRASNGFWVNYPNVDRVNLGVATVLVRTVASDGTERGYELAQSTDGSQMINTFETRVDSALWGT